MSLWRKKQPEVSPTSPARLLASSLTDPATRGEWRREANARPHGHSQTYRNDGRNIEVTRSVFYGFGLGGGGISFATPFTLNDSEKKIVQNALRAFDKHLSDQAEQAALARLAAPKKRRAAK